MRPLYAGIHAEDRRRIPPSLLPELWFGHCVECKAPIVCHKPALDCHRREWFLAGYRLQVVCPDCCNRLLDERGGVELLEFTPEVGKHFCRG